MSDSTTDSMLAHSVLLHHVSLCRALLQWHVVRIVGNDYVGVVDDSVIPCHGMFDALQSV